MAIMYPSAPIKTNSCGEEKVFELLKSTLDDSWIIFHSYKWQRDSGLREIDFILVNRTFGVMVIEVKGGKVSCSSHGNWQTIDRFNQVHQIKDPYRQVSSSQSQIHGELSEYLKENFNLKDVKCCRGVIFPETSTEDITSNNENYLKLTLFKNHLFSENNSFLPNLEQKLRMIQKNCYDIQNGTNIQYSDLNRKTQMSEEQFNIVINYFNAKLIQHYNPREVYLNAMTKIKELTENQAQIFEIIKLNKRVLISGLGGSGKTILAKNKVRWDIKCNKKILILASRDMVYNMFYNEFKGEKNVNLYMISKFLKMKEKDIYDTIIIDEGQTFSQENIEQVIEQVSRDSSSSIYIFYDLKQILVKRMLGLNFDYLKDFLYIPLIGNVRNSSNVLHLMEKIYGLTNTVDKNYNEKLVDLIFISSNNNTPITDYLYELYNERNSLNYNTPPQIITTSIVKKSNYVCDADHIDGRCRNSKFEYDKFGNIIGYESLDKSVCLSCTGSKFNTVGRLLGTEHDCVIVYDEAKLIKSENLNPNNNRPDAEYCKNVLYTAVSRAIYDLTIVLPFKSHNECQLISQYLDLEYTIQVL